MTVLVAAFIVINAANVVATLTVIFATALFYLHLLEKLLQRFKQPLLCYDKK